MSGSINLDIIMNFFSIVLIPCLALVAIMVVTVSNPIYSILFLILLFFLSSWVFIIFYLHFLSMIILMVYLGAVCVLFLFVIMMLNVKMLELKRNINFIPFLFVLLSFFLLLLLNYYGVISEWFMPDFFSHVEFLNKLDLFFFLKEASSIRSIGFILYTFFYMQFIISSLILFLAMIGAIFLTLDSSLDYRKEDFLSLIHI